MKFFAFLILLLCFFGLAAQNINTDYYKYGASPSKLPIYLLSDSLSGDIYLGISDPDLDSTQAVNQALKRAEALLYLSSNAHSRSFFDYYQGEEYSKGGGTFQSFIQLRRHDSVFTPYVVLDTFYTRFGEALVRIEPVQSDVVEGFVIGRSYDIHIDKFRMEYEWGGALEFEDQTEYKMVWQDSVPCNNKLSIFKYSKQFEAISTIDSVENYLPVLRYNYIENNPGKQQYFVCGLWVHFIDKLITQIEEQSRMANERIKKTEEAYEQITRLNQGIASNILSFRIQSIKFTEGEVHIGVDVDIIN